MVCDVLKQCDAVEVYMRGLLPLLHKTSNSNQTRRRLLYKPRDDFGAKWFHNRIRKVSLLLDGMVWRLDGFGCDSDKY